MHSVRSDGTTNKSTRLSFDVMFHSRANRSFGLSQSELKPHFADAKVSLPGHLGSSLQLHMMQRDIMGCILGQ